MYRLRDKISRMIMQGGIAFLLALAVGLPLLGGWGLSAQMPRFALLALAFCAATSLLRLRRHLLGASLLLGLCVAGAHYAMGGGWIADAMEIVRALILYYQGARVTLPLYAAQIAVQLALYCTLLGVALADPAVGAHSLLLALAAVLGCLQLGGFGAYTCYMLPALPAVLLMYAWTHADAPEGESPARRGVHPAVLPAVALLTGLALLLAPAEGTQVPALAQLAQQVRERAEELLSWQESRARYSLASDGWMPQGEEHLGGEPEPSDRTIMQVKTDDSVYLRGAILDTYTGGAWYDSLSTQRYGWYSRRYRTLRDQLMQADYPLVSTQNEKEATVTLLTNGASTLFVPQRLREMTIDGTMTAYFNDSSEVFAARNLQPQDAYTVRYLSMKSTDAGMAALAQANENAQDALFEQALAQYSQIPQHMQQEIYDIAQQATQGCNTPWQKATALRDYLSTHYAYSLSVQTPPSDVDFVAWFLLAEKQGYCTYFASAMTMLCRMAGLPARYVEGYLATPDGSGTAIVTGWNAHAWTEVYVNGVGWVVFDATPGAGDADQSSTPDSSLPPEQQPSPTPTATPSPSPSPTVSPSSSPSPSPQGGAATPTPTPTPSPTPAPDAPTPTPPPQDPPENKKNHLPWLWLLLVLAALALLAWRARVTEPAYRAARAGSDTAALLLWWQAITDCTGMLGEARRPVETPLSYAARMQRRLSVPLLPLAEAVSAAQYGRHAPQKKMLRQAEQTYAALHEQLDLWQKARLCLRRMTRMEKHKRRIKRRA